MTEAEKEQHTEESTPLNTSRLSTQQAKRSDFLTEHFSPARTRLAAPLLVEIYGRSLSRPNSFSSKQVFVDFITNLVSLNTQILFGFVSTPAYRTSRRHSSPVTLTAFDPSSRCSLLNYSTNNRARSLKKNTRILELRRKQPKLC